MKFIWHANSTLGAEAVVVYSARPNTLLALWDITIIVKAEVQLKEQLANG